MPRKAKNKKDFFTKKNVIVRLISYPLSLCILFIGVSFIYASFTELSVIGLRDSSYGLVVGFGLSVFPIAHFLLDFWEVYYGDNDNIGLENVLDDVV